MCYVTVKLGDWELHITCADLDEAAEVALQHLRRGKVVWVRTMVPEQPEEVAWA